MKLSLQFLRMQNDAKNRLCNVKLLNLLSITLQFRNDAKNVFASSKYMILLQINVAKNLPLQGRENVCIVFPFPPSHLNLWDDERIKRWT
jgi:hypothetical protein